MGPPDPFIKHLSEPWPATDWRSGEPRKVAFTYDDCMRVTEAVVDRFHGANDGRSTVCLAVPYLCGMSPRVMSGTHHYKYTAADVDLMVTRGEEAQAFARRHGIEIHTHGARGTFEYLEARAGRDRTLSVLGPNVIVAHGHGLTLADIDLLQEAGSSVVWVPFGSWGTKVGPTPVIELIRAGVRCAIATDGAAPYHVSDLFLDVHRAMFLVAENYHDASLLPAGKALRMITIEAAEVLGMASEIGSLEVGKKADIIVIDTAQPHLTPATMPVQLVSFFVRGNDVSTVVVDGKVLMEDRTVKTVDEAEVLAFAKEEIAASFDRIDIEPYLEMTREYWRGWRY
jgi:cytosine/adenosine deaminase-related metal-dependent hydrolase